jgi:hypothetical protein
LSNKTDIVWGISPGCLLSSLMMALYLKPLDDLMAPKTDGPDCGLFHGRFMDEWVVLGPSKWKLSKAICAVNRLLNAQKLKHHLGKTFIGLISHGFDFLGYRFAPFGLDIVPKTSKRMLEKLSRLYEQGMEPVHIGNT